MDRMARMFPKGFSVPSANTIFELFYSGVIYGCPTYFMCRTIPLAREGFEKDLASKKAMLARERRLDAKDDGA